MHVLMHLGKGGGNGKSSNIALGYGRFSCQLFIVAFVVGDGVFHTLCWVSACMSGFGF